MATATACPAAGPAHRATSGWMNAPAGRSP